MPRGGFAVGLGAGRDVVEPEGREFELLWQLGKLLRCKKWSRPTPSVGCQRPGAW